MNKVQAIVFFGIITVGLAISLFSLNHCSDRVEVTETPPAPPVETEPVEKTPTPKVEPDPTPAPPKAPTKPVPTKPDRPDGSFSSPALAMRALKDSLLNRDIDAFLETVGPNAVSPTTKVELTKLIENPVYRPRPQKTITEIAQTPGGESRWSIHLSATEGQSAPERQIFTDVAPTADKTGFRISKVTIPAIITTTKPPVMTPGAPGVSPSPITPTALVAAGEKADALTVAHAFSQAVVSKNFELARQLTDPEEVTDERVAALMMAIEEGQFKLREDKPLVVTLSRDDLKWVLTRIDSANAIGNSEFAIEMSPSKTNDWKIHQLTFSKLIASLAAKSGGGGVAYTPLIENPAGGDSIVLYFEFDNDGVTTRTSRQLQIVAGILKANPARKIHINGHADALGSEDYNFALSDKRAASIRKALTGFGVAPNQIVTKAFGKTRPVRPNFNPDGTDNPGNRSQNRRAEVYLDF